jgi:WD40 repeat protein
MTRYALVVGIAQYDSIGSLSKPTQDAEVVARVLEEHGGFQVKRLPEGWDSQRNCYKVASTQLNGADLGQGLQDFIVQADRKEALIYFSGHGFTVADNLQRKKGYLATSDCTNNTIATRGICLDSFNQLILESNLSSLVVLFDCCHAGSILESNLVRQSLTAFNSSQKDYYLIAACRASESAWEGNNYSVFTEALLQGLSPENASSEGQVSCDRVFDFIASRLKNSGQEPIRMGWGTAINLVQYQPKITKTTINETCPYQGLLPFTKEQAHFFFGREKVVQLLMEKLENYNFVPIIGASGSGKSSVVRAGLIPELEKNGWQILDPITPDVEPLSELRRAFKKYFPQPKELHEYIRNHPQGLHEIILRLPANENFLLVIDQFEEVFTLCSQESERNRFIELLTSCPSWESNSSQRLAIVTTMRADFLESCLHSESLTQLIQEQKVLMPPLVGANLEKAIALPAQLQGYRFEEGLLGEIIQDVGKEEGCLPLLQFALTELWEKRDKHKIQLTLEKYQEMGGVIGALNRHAESIYQSLNNQQQELLKRIFLKLVRTNHEDKDIRQRQPQNRLHWIKYPNNEQETVNDVLEKLIQGRLVIGNVWLDLAHEALMEGWERFVEWRKEGRELRRLIDRIEDALREWQKEHKDENLMMGGLLAQVREQWQQLEPNLDDLARDFYQRSDAHEKDQIATLERALNQSKLREKATTVLNLLPFQPLESLMLAIQSIGENLEKIPDVVLAPVQHSLHNAMEKIKVSISSEQGRFTVNSIAISSDRKIIVAGNGDGVIRLYDLKFQQIGEAFHKYHGSVYSVAISPDGKTIASGSNDGKVRLWDITGKLIAQPFVAHENYVAVVIFSPDGKTIISGGDDNTLRLWNLDSIPATQKIFRGHKDTILSIAISPDGKRIVSGSRDRTIRLWDTEGNQICDAFRGHEAFVRSVAVSSDGQKIASSSADGTVRLWDFQGKQIVQSFTGHEGYVNAVSFSPDAMTIASVGNDGTLRLWDLSGNQICKPLHEHKSSVISLTYSKNGQQIVTSGSGGTIRLWDLAGSSLSQPFKINDTSIKLDSKSPDAKNIVRSVAISPDGKQIASGSADGTIRLWDIEGNAIGSEFLGHEDSVWSLKFSDDGQMIVSGSDDGTIRLWDLAGNGIAHPLITQDAFNFEVFISPCGQQIISGSRDGKINVWDIRGNLISQTPLGEDGYITAVAISPDGQQIATGNRDGSIQLWDILGNSLSKASQGHTGYITTIAFSYDGKQITTGSVDNTVLLWNIDCNPIVKPFYGHEGYVWSVAFSPDGKTIASGSDDKTIRLWDLSGNPICQPFIGHEDAVTSVIFSLDGQIVVSGSEDGTVRLWRGNWQAWLKVCCDRLRYHPVFTNPITEDAQAACEICRKYVWEINAISTG